METNKVYWPQELKNVIIREYLECQLQQVKTICLGDAGKRTLIYSLIVIFTLSKPH